MGLNVPQIAITLIVIIIKLSIAKETTLCNKHNASCSYLLWRNNSQPPQACRITYFKLNSVECTSYNFQYKTSESKLSDVQLRAYTSFVYGQTMIDVIFTNITWKRAQMRFSKMGFENEKNMCGTFHIWDNVTVSQNSDLIYNCPWSNSDYMGQHIAFEYEFGMPAVMYTKFILTVPYFKYFEDSADVKTLQLFCYVDVTNSEYLRLHIQTAPAKYNITGYFIEVIRERSNISTQLTVQILNARDAIKGQLIFEYPTWNEFGYFYFTVSPLSDVCEENMCMKSFTPKEFVGRKKSSLVIGIVGASVILFALFYAMFFWNRQKNQKEDISHQVLLVYSAAVLSHSTVVHNLARFLTEVLHIEVYLFDISHTSRKNSPLWSSDSFDDASHIIYIVSPKRAQEMVHKSEEDPKTFIERKLVSKKNSKQIFVVSFPYSVNDIPTELNQLNVYNLMVDMDSLVNALIKPPYQSWMFLQIYRPSRFTGEQQYLDLETSIQIAQTEIVGTSNNGAKSIDSMTTNEDGNEDDIMLLKPAFLLPNLDLSGGGQHNITEQQQQQQNRIIIPTVNVQNLDL